MPVALGGPPRPFNLANAYGLAGPPSSVVYDARGNRAGGYGNFYGPTVTRPNPRLTSQIVELLRQAAAPGPITFVPHHSLTAETPEMRRDYRNMLRNPYLKAAVFTNVLQVASLPYQVQPSKWPGPFAEESAANIDYSLETVEGGFAEIVWDMLIGGMLGGHSICEPVYEVADSGPEAGRVVLCDFKARDDLTYLLDIDEFLNITSVQATVFNLSERFDPADFIIFTHNKIFDNPLGISDFRAVWAAVQRYDMITRLEMIGLDKFALPFMKVTYEAPEYIASIDEAFTHARDNGYVRLPKGVEAEIMNLMTGGQDAFQKSKEDAAKEIAIGISGAYLHMLTSGTTDDRGDSGVQKSTSELIPWWLSQRACNALNHQWVPRQCRWNFGLDCALPRVTMGAVNVTEMLNDLQLDTGLLGLGIDLSVEERRGYYGRQAPADPKDSLIARKALVSMIGQPPPGEPGGDGSSLMGGGGGGKPKGGGDGALSFYDPNEPRDAIGRWTEGGGSDQLHTLLIGELSRVEGFQVRRTSTDEYRIETQGGGKGVVKGDAATIREHIARQQASSRAYGSKLSAALARVADYDEPSFMEPDRLAAADRAFRALPAGAPVVSLEEESHGRTGKIVKDSAGKNRVKLDGEDGFASNHVEPIDHRLSWRAPKGEGSAKPSQSFLFADEAEGHWITIGGRKDEGGKRHGGSPVFIRNGRIEKGAPGLAGQKLGSLGKQQTTRESQHSEKYAARSRWAKEAKAAGVHPEHLHELAGEMMAHDREHVKERTQLLKDARKRLDEFGGQWKTIGVNAGSGRYGDAGSIKGLDEVAEDLAKRYPEQFRGESEHTSDRLFSMLAEGNPETMTEDDAHERALAHLYQHSGGSHGHHVSEEPIPFADHYDPDQPRDDVGRWAASGAGAHTGPWSVSHHHHAMQERLQAVAAKVPQDNDLHDEFGEYQRQAGADDPTREGKAAELKARAHEARSDVRNELRAAGRESVSFVRRQVLDHVWPKLKEQATNANDRASVADDLKDFVDKYAEEFRAGGDLHPGDLGTAGAGHPTEDYRVASFGQYAHRAHVAAVEAATPTHVPSLDTPLRRATRRELLALVGLDPSGASLEFGDFDESKHPRGQPKNAGQFGRVAVGPKAGHVGHQYHGQGNQPFPKQPPARPNPSSITPKAKAAAPDPMAGVMAALEAQFGKGSVQDISKGLPSAKPKAAPTAPAPKPREQQLGELIDQNKRDLAKLQGSRDQEASFDRARLQHEIATAEAELKGGPAPGPLGSEPAPMAPPPTPEPTPEETKAAAKEFANAAEDLTFVLKDLKTHGPATGTAAALASAQERLTRASEAYQSILARVKSPTLEPLPFAEDDPPAPAPLTVNVQTPPAPNVTVNLPAEPPLPPALIRYEIVRDDDGTMTGVIERKADREE